MPNELPIILVILGILITTFGLFWLFLGKLIPLENLPGNIVIKKPNTTIYFPLATSIILSIFLTVIFLIFKLLIK